MSSFKIENTDQITIAYAIRRGFKNGYSFLLFRHDLIAGIIVGVLAMPLAMALAIASGVPPQHGLYAAIVAGALIGFLGGSPVNISGPTAAFVVILLPITQVHGVGGLLVATVMAGLILLVMGFARMGRLIQFIPYPVTTGFTSGIAVVIATLQLKDFFGLYELELTGAYWEKLTQLVIALPQFHWQDCLIGFVSLVFMIWKLPFYRYIPSHAFALIMGTLVAILLGLVFDGFSVATIGSNFNFEINGVIGSGVPPVLPGFVWPWQFPSADGQSLILSWQLVQSLIGPAFAIAMLAAIEALLCSVIADGLAGTRHNANSELIGQGIGNIVTPFFGGMTATAAISRTATNIRAGGKTPVSAIIHALVILLAVAWIAPFLSYIPMASLSALLFVVAWHLGAPKHFIHLVKSTSFSDASVLVTCTSLTILFDMVLAVGVGIVLAALLFIKRMSELTGVKLVTQSQEETAIDVPSDVAIYDINGPLFFGAAEKALRAIHNAHQKVRVVILEMNDVNFLDMTGMVALESLIHYLNNENVIVIIANLERMMAADLRKLGVKLSDESLYFVDSVQEAKIIALSFSQVAVDKNNEESL